MGARPTFHRQDVMKESPPTGDSCSAVDSFPTTSEEPGSATAANSIRHNSRCKTEKGTCVPFPKRTVFHLLEGDLLEQANADQCSSASVHGVRQRGGPAHKEPVRVRDACSAS